MELLLDWKEFKVYVEVKVHGFEAGTKLETESIWRNILRRHWSVRKGSTFWRFFQNMSQWKFYFSADLDILFGAKCLDYNVEAIEKAVETVAIVTWWSQNFQLQTKQHNFWTRFERIGNRIITSNLDPERIPIELANVILVKKNKLFPFTPKFKSNFEVFYFVLCQPYFCLESQIREIKTDVRK